MARNDIDISFNPHPLNGDVSLKSGRQAAEQSMKNLVLTNFYERGFNVFIGANVTNSLFENFTPLEQQTLKQNIIRVVNNFEPEIEIDDVTVESTNSNEITANIYYFYQNNPEVNIFTIPLERIR